MREILFAVALSALICGGAHAEGDCQGEVLVTHPGAYYKKGDIVHDLSPGYDDYETKKFPAPRHPDHYDEHGGGTYQTNEMKILNCHLVLQPDNRYGFDFDKTDANADVILESKIEKRLLEVGVSNAVATNSGPDSYLNHRQSACGKAVAKVMSGDDTAGELVQEVCP